MQTLRLLIVFLLLSSFVRAQKIEAHFFDRSDSSHNNMVVFLPEKVPVRGLLVLLDGMGGMDIPNATPLPYLAAKQGWVTMMPVLAPGVMYFGIDSGSQASLDLMIQRAIARYRLEGKKLAIGGFSIGGACAVKWAGRAADGLTPARPSAVFAVDPPLDFERYYNAAKRMTRLATKERPATGETTMMIDWIEREMGGVPQQARANYYRMAPYSFSDPEQRAARKLLNTPLMLITEPDIQWWLKERQYDYDFINAPDCAGLVNELQRMGNRNAVLTTTSNKGYRVPGHRRHPHSWSIVDAGALLKWLGKF